MNHNGVCSEKFDCKTFKNKSCTLLKLFRRTSNIQNRIKYNITALCQFGEFRILIETHSLFVIGGCLCQCLLIIRKSQHYVVERYIPS